VPLTPHPPEEYYIFPSGFAYLSSRLKEEVFPTLNRGGQRRLVYLDKRLREMRLSAAGENYDDDDDNDNDNDNSTHRLSPHDLYGTEGEAALLKREMDGLIAAECPLTGTVIIEKIGRGLPGGGGGRTTTCANLILALPCDRGKGDRRFFNVFLSV